MYNQNQQLHFIGIGGVGMAGIAEVLLNLGYSVSGSDAKQSALTEHLRKLGANVVIGHSEENIPKNCSVVVISSAVRKENCELIEAIERGIPVIPRAEMLGELMHMKYGVAIAGSHGKTTTTSMVARVLAEVGLDPTVIIGGRILSQNTGARLGTGQYLVAEADESDGSFCMLRPAIAVVTNIDSEHLGHYGSFGALEAAFQQFMSAVPFYGLVVSCFDDPVVQRLSARLKRRVISYGMSREFEVSACDIKPEGRVTAYTLCLRGEEVARVSLPMPGAHMVSNSLAACAVGLELGAFVPEIAQALSTFPGVSRRSEVIADAGGVLILDDYAHHPTEISATLRAIKNGWLIEHAKVNENPAGKLVVIFQPHRYSRTKELFSEFLQCFSHADEVIVTDIYPAGEDEIPGISSSKLAQAVQHQNVSYLKDFRDAAKLLAKRLVPGDIVMTLGAGSITTLGSEIANALGDKRNFLKVVARNQDRQILEHG